MTHEGRLGWACVLIGTTAVVNLSGQTLGPSQFSVRSDLVRIEVGVLDAERRPVRGLRPGDFTVLEDGVPRPVVAFHEVVTRNNTDRQVLPHMPDVASNRIDLDRRLIVILLDNSIESPWALQQSRRIGRTVVESLAEGDLAAVVFTTASSSGQPFTTDRIRLLRAIDRLAPRAASASLAFLETLSNVTEILAGASDRRRFIVAIASGVPMDLRQVASPASVGSPVGATVELQDQFRLTQAILSIARQSNINIYTIDPYGLYTGVGGADARRLHREFLQTVAANTGARSVVNTNDFASGVAGIFTENSTYYLLGFEPGPMGGSRRLEVRVASAETVRAQSAVPIVRSRVTEATVEGAFASLLPDGRTPLALWAAPVVGSSSTDVAVVLMGAEGSPGTLHVQVNAYDLDGRRRASVAGDVQVDDTDWELPLRLRLRPGRYQLRAVTSELRAGNVMGSVYADVDVPDLTGERLWLSPIGVHPASRQEVTARRHFLPADRLRFRAQVYSRDWKRLGALSLQMTLVDGSGHIVRQRQETVQPPGGNRGAADWADELALAGLAPGAYVLRVSAEGTGATATREVPFTVEDSRRAPPGRAVSSAATAAGTAPWRWPSRPGK